MKCDTIRDLIPLYSEKLCSEESRELVEEHIKDCEECRRLAQSNIDVTDKSTGTVNEAAAFSRVNRKMKKSKAKIIILSIIIAAVVLALGALTVFQICKIDGTVSFETIIQNAESRRNIKNLVNGDMTAYIDGISRSDKYNSLTLYKNYDIIKQQNTEYMQKLYDEKIAALEPYIKSSSSMYMSYDSVGDYTVHRNMPYNVSNTYIIGFGKNSYELELYVTRGEDGEYYSSTEPSDTDDCPEIAEFCKAIDYVNNCTRDSVLRDINEILLTKPNEAGEYTSRINLFINNYSDAYSEKISEGLNDYYNSGYSFSDVSFSTARYDEENSKLYCNITFFAQTENAKAVMKKKLYIYPEGYVPSDEAAQIVVDDDNEDFANALRNIYD